LKLIEEDKLPEPPGLIDRPGFSKNKGEGGRNERPGGGGTWV